MPQAHEKAYADWLKFITSDPALEDILEYHILDEAQARVRILQDVVQRRDLTAAEHEELEVYLQLEYLIQTAKVEALEEMSRKKP